MTQKKLKEIPGVERGTIVNETAYIQITENKNKITAQIKNLIDVDIKVEFIKLPLDNRHNGKIKYNELSH